MCSTRGANEFEPGGDPVVAAHPDEDEQVGVAHRAVGEARAHETDHLQRQRIAHRVGAGAEQRPAGGDVGAVRQFDHLRLRTRDDHAATDEHDRALGLCDQLGDAAQLHRVRLGRVGERAHPHRLGARHVLRDGLLEVLGEVDEHRSGPPRPRHVEGLVQGGSDVLDARHQVAVLGDRHRRADHVQLLERVGADRGDRDLAGDGHHRNRVRVGGGQAGDHVERAGTAGGEHHADGTAAAARVPVGGVRAALLVAHQHVVQLRVGRKVLVEGQVGPARVPEDRAHPLREEALEDDLGPGEQARLRGRLLRRSVRVSLDHL